MRNGASARREAAVELSLLLAVLLPEALPPIASPQCIALSVLFPSLLLLSLLESLSPHPVAFETAGGGAWGCGVPGGAMAGGDASSSTWAAGNPALAK